MGAGIPRARTCCFALPGMSIWPCAMCVHSARSLVCMAGAQSTEQCLMYMVPCAVQPTREQDRQCGGALQSTDAEPTERSVEHMLLLGHVLSLVLCVCVRSYVLAPQTSNGPALYNTLLSAPCSEPAPLSACDKPTPPRPAPHARQLPVRVRCRMSRVISSPPTTTCSFGCALRPAPSVARRNARVRCTHLAIGRAPVPPPTPREHSAGECADGRGAVCRSRERLECRAEAGRRVLSTTRRCRAFGPAGRCSPHPSVRAHPQPARSVVQSHAPWRSVKCISLVCCLSDQSAHFTFSQHPPPPPSAGIRMFSLPL